MAKRKAQPWDAAFQRVRAIYWPQFNYPPKPTAVDLDAVEKELNFQFPLSYRAFAEEYGLGGELHGGLPNVLSLTQPPWTRETDWYRSVVGATNFWHTYEWEERWYGAESIAFRKRVIPFAMDSGYHDWVFDPTDVTHAKRREYRIYDVNRGGEITAIAPSFGEWLVWIDTHYRFEREEDDEGEPEFPPAFKPDSPLPDPMPYGRRHLSQKEAPDSTDVALWLANNNHTVRDLARAIRDHGRTDAFPILADALQEAGCSNDDLLNSCRTGDPDIDGSWVLQVLLGKA